MNISFLQEMEKWKYNQYFPEFDMSAYRQSFDQGDEILHGPANCEGYAITLKNEIIGLFEFYPQMKNKPEIGLALHPKFIYQGLGSKIMDNGIRFILENKNYKEEAIYLTVSSENIPALKFYTKFGFKIYEDVKNEEQIVTDYKMRYLLKKFK